MNRAVFLVGGDKMGSLRILLQQILPANPPCVRSSFGTPPLQAKARAPSFTREGILNPFIEFSLLLSIKTGNRPLSYPVLGNRPLSYVPCLTGNRPLSYPVL